jgi:hypothetical protein
MQENIYAGMVSTVLIIIMIVSIPSGDVDDHYAQILRKVSQDPVQRQSPLGETPRHDTRFS